LWQGAERVWSTVGDANFLALVLLASLPVSYFCFLAARRLRAKALYLAVTAVLAMGIFVSLSRGGLLALVAAAALLFLSNARRRFTWVLATLVLMAGFFLIPRAVWTRFLSIGDFAQDPSISQRVHILQSGARMFRDHFVFGVGAGNFPIAYPDYRDLSEEEGEMRAAHNSLLEVAAETGAIGLAAFLALVVYALRNCHLARRAARRSAESDEKQWIEALAGGLAVALVAQMVSMCFISALWVKSFWITVALTVCLKKIAERSAAARASADALATPLGANTATTAPERLQP
jgi:O-antigen ligase